MSPDLKMKQNMKNLNRILFTVVTTASLGLIPSALANDGVVASPKLRQSLNDQSLRAVPAHASTAVAGACCENKIVASPKVVQTQPAEQKCCASSPKDILASTTTKPNDGIFASPQVRAQLNERPQQFQIAPIK